jgi:hypothetical protein
VSGSGFDETGEWAKASRVAAEHQFWVPLNGKHGRVITEDDGFNERIRGVRDRNEVRCQVANRLMVKGSRRGDHY